MVPRAPDHATAPSDDRHSSPFFASSSSSAFLSTLPVDDFDPPNLVYLSPVSLTTCPIISTYDDCFEQIVGAMVPPAATKSADSSSVQQQVAELTSDINNMPSGNFLSKVIDDEHILPNLVNLSALFLPPSPTTFGWENISPFDDGVTSSCATTSIALHPCSSSTTIKTKTKSKKTVSFSNVSIQEHSIIVGDHPCAMTLPISLGWHHAHPLTMRLDAYEQLRGPRRRRGTEMCMPYYEKKNILRRISGMSEVDILKAERRIRMTQNAMDGDEGFWSKVPATSTSVSAAGKEGRMHSNMHRVKTLEAMQRMEDGEDGCM
mmetsp:Transcript_27986/g.80896  ORF Transcript_27986/g.80896 Transcript_27986/m.80896 type:complete len:319 (+) Transcript_27986:96-1052(+)